MELWRPLNLNFGLTPISVIAATTIVALVLALVYYFNIRKVKANEAPGKFVLLFSSVVAFIRSMVVDVIGPKHVKLTPYFLFMFVWLLISNVVVLIGFKEAGAFLTIPLSFAVMTWIGSQVLAVRYQKFSYFNKFLIRIKIKGVKIPILINPIEIVGKLIPIVSLTFRMWGNIAAGAIIYALFWWGFANFTVPYPQIGILLLAGSIVMPFIYGYFTLFASVIQGFVFTLISTTYWGQEIREGIEHHEHLKHEKMLKQQRKLAAIAKKEGNETVALNAETNNQTVSVQ